MSIAGIAPVIRHKTLAEDIYERLRTAIMTGAVKPGEKISARSVADSAKVSFTPAREAVARLIAEGALELAGPKTVIVPTLTREALDEISMIRLNVEGMAAEVAAANFHKSDMNKIEALQKQYEKTRTGARFQESLVLNEKFHFMIYNACKMPRLITFIESLWLQTGPSFNFFASEGPLPERPHEFHKDAIEGLRAGNGRQVKKAIQADIKFGHKRLRDLIDE